jgi:hypothetical protein
VAAAVANFLAVALWSGRDGLRLYTAYAAGMIGFYVVLTLGITDTGLPGFLNRFYEIHVVEGATWWAAVMAGLLGAGALFGLQALRRRFFLAKDAREGRRRKAS